ncbi:hypothetical protein, partial [Pseudomonas aeruginosa]
VQPIQPHTPLFIIINSGNLLLSLKAVLPNLIRYTSTTDTPIDGDDREFGKNRTLSFASSCNQFIVFSMDERKWRKLFDKQIGIL